jgi:hypothetical protein
MTPARKIKKIGWLIADFEETASYGYMKDAITKDGKVSYEGCEDHEERKSETKTELLSGVGELLELEVEIKKILEDKFSCLICKETFDNVLSLRKHVKSHLKA